MCLGYLLRVFCLGCLVVCWLLVIYCCSLFVGWFVCLLACILLLDMGCCLLLVFVIVDVAWFYLGFCLYLDVVWLVLFVLLLYLTICCWFDCLCLLFDLVFASAVWYLRCFLFIVFRLCLFVCCGCLFSLVLSYSYATFVVFGLVDLLLNFGCGCSLMCCCFAHYRFCCLDLLVVLMFC